LENILYLYRSDRFNRFFHFDDGIYHVNFHSTLRLQQKYEYIRTSIKQVSLLLKTVKPRAALFTLYKIEPKGAGLSFSGNLTGQNNGGISNVMIRQFTRVAILLKYQPFSKSRIGWQKYYFRYSGALMSLQDIVVGSS
jgi:hypothetical protein